MFALAGDFYFLGAGIAARIAAIFLVTGHLAFARLMGTGLRFLFSHHYLLIISAV
jgi:hypothetical protein